MATKTSINRRDFISGTALSLALGTALSPLEILARTADLAAAHKPGGYPPSLTGMRGSHDGTFEVAHAVARSGKKFPRPRQQTDDTYDLIVVGAGISGLSAAKFFRDRTDGPKKILLLDNHDDFGGHARRNEFSVGGKTLLGYGGSQTIDNPAKYSKVAQELLRDLSIDVQRFYDYFDQDYFDRRGMRSGLYFDEATFGKNKLVENPIAGLLSEGSYDDQLADAVAAMPIADLDKALFVKLLRGGVDYLDGMSKGQKIKLLGSISYLDYLKEHAGMSDAVCRILQDTFLPMISLGWEAESAYEAAAYWFPGTFELGVQDEEDDDEPYIFHFPDGNAGVARALVRDLIPAAISGHTMEDLVTARADYALLDCADNDTRIRLESTAVDVANTADGRHADVTYVNNGGVYRCRAKHVVMACYNGILPYICSELPERQIEALQSSTKIPFVIGSFALNNWRAFAESGFHRFYSPGDVFFKHMLLDFPVSMGDYQYSKSPDEPIVVSAWYSPTTRGLPAKDQYRAGQAKLLQMSYDDFEQDIQAHLDGMLGAHGFDADRDIAAITLNRWPHGYAYEYEGVGVSGDYDRYHGPHIQGRQQVGRISIANSDSEAYAYANGAIDAADRAVNEQLS